MLRRLGLRPWMDLPGRLLAGLLSLVFVPTLWGVAPVAWAQVNITTGAGGVLPVPALSARVIDQTGTLTAEQVRALSDQLQALETQRGSQVVILMVPTTQPEDIAAYAQRVGDSWKIGRREVGDGLLIVVALQDRRRLCFQQQQQLPGSEWKFFSIKRRPRRPQTASWSRSTKLEH